MKERLVILSTHFGTNFSGGSKATCEIFSLIEDHFSEIIVIGTQLGIHPFKSLKFIHYKNWLHGIKLIKSLNDSKTVFYGDFYNTILCAFANVPYYFTYHDNWPDLRRNSVYNWIIGLYYWTIYKQIFRKALAVVIVSEFRRKSVVKFNQKIRLIRNGVSTNQTRHSEDKKSTILMVGNIDSRKYNYAIDLFELLLKKNLTLKVDIYGHIIHHKIAHKLCSFPFVSLKGFTSDIPYSNYQCLLHTSVMENLSIAWAEALKNTIPVITFSVGGASELIDDSNGFLIEPYNIHKMSEAVNTVLSKGKKHFKCISLHKDFSWEIASQHYLQLLQPNNQNS